MKKQNVVHKVSLTKIFLDKETYDSVVSLMKGIKDKYKTYPKEDLKKSRLKSFAENMWNSLKNEFFHSCKICPNTLWEWQDKFSAFDEYGYLLDEPSVELSDWSAIIEGWYKREWAIEVMKLIKDFNLDNQDSDYVTVFKNDFMKVKNDQEFCSTLLKWSDLIYWSPWKLALYDNTFQQPLNAHYDDEFNDDYDSMDNDEGGYNV